jgi:hypothetical protein
VLFNPAHFVTPGIGPHGAEHGHFVQDNRRILDEYRVGRLSAYVQLLDLGPKFAKRLAVGRMLNGRALMVNLVPRDIGELALVDPWRRNVCERQHVP